VDLELPGESLQAAEALPWQCLTGCVWLGYGGLPLKELWIGKGSSGQSLPQIRERILGKPAEALEELVHLVPGRRRSRLKAGCVALGKYG
jgi:hypothetical protein